MSLLWENCILIFIYTVKINFLSFHNLPWILSSWIESFSSFKFAPSHVESSPPLDTIWFLDEIPSHDKTLTVANQIKDNHLNNKLNTESHSMVKNMAKTALHNFSTRGTTFRLRISQSSSSFVFSLPISPCAPFLGTHLSLCCISCMTWRRLEMSQCQPYCCLSAP